jgi:hypothetical protein
MPELILRDFFSFAPSAGRGGGTSSDPSIREAAKSGKGLKISFVASHAGTRNGNHVMYSPAGMRDCSYTWVWPQRKPIQIHHDDKADPIGRVINARYVPYNSSDVAETQSDSLSAFDGLVKDKVTDGARALEAAKVLGDKDWKGIGELILDGVVTDSSAIEKILDGRYLGVSVTQKPKQAFCSLCDVNWVKDGPCEHERGAKDEETGRNMYLVVGDTDYVEISYVNRPADPHAMGSPVQQVEVGENMMSQQDSLSDKGMLDTSMQTTVFFQLVDSLNEAPEMADVIDNQTPEKTLDTETGLADVKTEETSTKKPTEDSAKEQDSNGKEEKALPVKDSAPEATVEEALKCLFEDRDSFNESFVDLINDAMESLVDERDAKLSTDKRKRLASSTFCGPNRSFPVPDCADVTAARRLIGRYKGPGDKSSILSCVSKKAKALGCSTSKDAQEPEADRDNAFSLTDLNDEDLVKTHLSVEKIMVERGVRAPRVCEHCDEKDSVIAGFETEVPELQDTVKVLRSEYKTVLGEHDASEESHQSTLAELRTILSDSVLTTFLLTDKDTSEKDLEIKVNSMTMEELKDMTKKMNISEVISFVRSGMSRKPTESVTQQDAEPEEEKLSDPVVNLSKSLVNFHKNHGVGFATRCMYDFISAGKLPEDFTLDKAFEVVAE